LGRIPEATIREIRDRADIVGLIGRYVELKKSGRSYTGLCPFHDEKTPSFNVNPDRQFFHCFGCQAGGDAIAFLIKHDNLTFSEAVRSLAADLGIVIPESAREDHGIGERIRAALDLAQLCYRDGLASREGEVARRYLAGRGLDAKTIDHFGLGYVPDRWDVVTDALRAAGIDSEVGRQAGLLSRSNSSDRLYDLLRARITFPIRDVRGRVIAFGGRTILADQKPKYLNTPESPVFRKRESFYGFPWALEAMRRSGRVVICEGYFDAIALHRAGVAEALATCGTALTSEHAQQLRRRSERVCLLFDGDDAGQKAMERALAVLLPEGLRVSAVSLPGRQDPDDYLNAHGAEALRALIEASVDAIDVVMRRALAGGWSSPDQKADVVERVAPFITLVPNPIARGEYARRLAVATDSRLHDIESLLHARAKGSNAGLVVEPSAAVASGRRESQEERHLRELATVLSRYPSFVSGDLDERLREILPSGAWREVILELLDAWAQGRVDAEGAVDIFELGDRLGAEELAMLRAAAIDDTLLQSEMSSPRETLAHLVSHFETRQIELQEKALRRRMQNPDEDPMHLLRERQALLERRRASTRLGTVQTP